MSVQELGRGVHYHVCAQGDRPLEVRRHESVVDNQFDFSAAADSADCLNVANGHHRIGRSFYVDQPRVLADGTLNVASFGAIDVRKLHAEVAQNLVEQARYSTVEIVSANHVISGLVHRGNCIDGRHAAGKYPCGSSSFESRQILLEAVTCGV